ncbi:dna repair transcription protein, partial [Moniliophthora roreri]
MNGTSQDAQKCIETAICRLTYHGWPFILITESTNNLLLKQSHVTLGASIARGTQKQWYLLKYIDNSLP